MEPGAYEFCGIRVDLRLVSVTRDGRPVALEPKAFDVLRYLIEHRDRLVTKEEILDTVWKNTFVTPNVLTRVIAQLRKALGDGASEARIIETVAKRGYRFIAGVDPVGDHAPHPSQPLPPRPAADEPSGSQRKRISPGLPLLAGLAVLAMVGLASAFLVREDAPLSSTRSSVTPFTRFATSAGYNGMAAVSADGKSLAYVSDRTGSLEIYVTNFSFGSQELRITDDGGNNLHPAWSPDGEWIAFHSRARRGIWIVPATGGTPRQIVDFGSEPCWSPDGTQIAFTSNAGGGFVQSVIWTVSRDGTGRRQLTRPGSPPGGQTAPSWSPDGRFIAFAVGFAGQGPGLMLVAAADGQVTPLRKGNASHPRFSRDGRAVYWVEMSEGENRLMRMHLAPDGRPADAPEIVRALDRGIADGLSVAEDGTTAVSITRDDWNIWAIDVMDGAGPGVAREPVRLTNDSVRVARPDYSVDGRIAFSHTNPGRPVTAWVMNEKDSQRVPLLDPPTSSPEWTRDGKALLVVHGPDSRYWRVDPTTLRGEPLGVTTEGMGFPRISPDGRSVAYHVVQPDGVVNVWTRPLDGGPARQITFDAQPIGFPAWSPDGRWLAVEMIRGDNTYLAVLPSGGGALEQLVFEPGQTFVHSWSPDGREIAFAGERDGVWNIYAVSRETRAIRQFTHFNSSAGYVRYPSWSPRGRRIAFERNIRTGNILTGRLPDGAS